MGELVAVEQVPSLARSIGVNGQSIGLAFGDFDLFHVGHVRYLQAASREADVLVVAVHDDAPEDPESPDRPPALRAEHRAEIVAAVRGVDYVVIAAASAFGSLVDALVPSVVCVRARATDEVVRSADVAARVRTVQVGDINAPTTADVLSRIRASAARVEPPAAR